MRVPSERRHHQHGVGLLFWSQHYEDGVPGQFAPAGLVDGRESSHSWLLQNLIQDIMK